MSRIKAKIVTAFFLALFLASSSPASAQTKADSTKTTPPDSLFTIPRAELHEIVAKLKAYQTQLKTEYNMTEGKIELIQQMISDTTKTKAK